MFGGLKLGLFTTLAVALVVGCGPTDESVAPEKMEPPEKTEPVERTANPEPSRIAARFVGTEWQLTLLNGRELLSGTNITLEIDREEGRVGIGGTATCNFYGTDNATMKDGVLKLRGGTVTEMGCTGDIGVQETTYLDALYDAATYRQRGDTLEVQNSQGTTTLVYEQESLARSNPADLAGMRWLLRSVGGKPLPDDFPATVSFDTKKRLSGYDGCLHFTGLYDANESDLSLGAYGYEVEEHCLKPGAYGEGRPAAVMQSMPLEGNYFLGKGRLEVKGDSGVVSVYEPLRKDADVEDSGSAWVLEKFIDGTEETSVLEGTRITLKFDRGTLRRTGTMSGSTGCNTYSAEYEYINESMAGAPVVTSVTEKACSAPAGVMEQEQRYLSRLEDVHSYSTEIEGGLKLFTRDRKQKLVFVPPD